MEIDIQKLQEERSFIRQEMQKKTKEIRQLVDQEEEITSVINYLLKKESSKSGREFLFRKPEKKKQRRDQKTFLNDVKKSLTKLEDHAHYKDIHSQMQKDKTWFKSAAALYAYLKPRAIAENGIQFIKGGNFRIYE